MYCSVGCSDNRDNEHNTPPPPAHMRQLHLHANPHLRLRLALRSVPETVLYCVESDTHELHKEIDTFHRHN
jgi:hypothetical protein